MSEMQTTIVNRPTGEPLIKITFTKDKIFELNDKGQHGPERTRERILMSVINISGIENMKVNEQSLDNTFQQCATLTFPAADPPVTSTVYYKMVDGNTAQVKIAYNLPSLIIDVGGANQKQGDCVYSDELVIAHTCVQHNAFLWEGNMYKCYQNCKEKQYHDTAQKWFCKSCAKPGVPGMLQRCPLHLISGLQYPEGHPFIADETLKPVYQ